MDEHGVQQEEAPEEDFGEAEEGADELQQEGEEATASDSRVYETDMVRWGPPQNLLLWIDCILLFQHVLS